MFFIEHGAFKSNSMKTLTFSVNINTLGKKKSRSISQSLLILYTSPYMHFEPDSPVGAQVDIHVSLRKCFPFKHILPSLLSDMPSWVSSVWRRMRDGSCKRGGRTNDWQCWLYSEKGEKKNSLWYLKRQTVVCQLNQKLEMWREKKKNLRTKLDQPIRTWRWKTSDWWERRKFGWAEPFLDPSCC